jgi:Fur family ferric uptake transcriptional regulator
MTHKSEEKISNFESFLTKRGLKMTYERKHIFERVSRLKGHFDADGLYEILCKENERIARGTVYRTIPLLLESGMIQKSVGRGKKDFFESTIEKKHHDHMVCMVCNDVIEFHSADIERIQDALCEKFDFEMMFHDHRIFGRCSDCKE